MSLLSFKVCFIFLFFLLRQAGHLASSFGWPMCVCDWLYACVCLHESVCLSVLGNQNRKIDAWNATKARSSLFSWWNSIDGKVQLLKIHIRNHRIFTQQYELSMSNTDSIWGIRSSTSMSKIIQRRGDQLHNSSWLVIDMGWTLRQIPFPRLFSARKFTVTGQGRRSGQSQH